MATDIIKTEHPHIVRVPGVCSGEPIVEGTRISVVFIVRQRADGETPEAIARGLPHITLAAVYDAISYYHDHKHEIDTIIAENTPSELARRHGWLVDERGQVHFPVTN